MAEYNIEQEYTVRNTQTNETLTIMGGAVREYLAKEIYDNQHKPIKVYELVE
jgi:hypothetical protein